MSTSDGPLSENSGLCGGPGQISCHDANEMIQDFLDRAVDPTSGELLYVHLDECPPCEQEFVLYQRILGALTRNRPNIPSDTALRLESYGESLCAGDVVVDETVTVTVDRTVTVDGTKVFDESSSFAETTRFVEAVEDEHPGGAQA